MPGRTQEALYAEVDGIDLELSWSETQLPQVERTKHVNGLHPYLGKYVPQLVEAFLQRRFEPGQYVFDPFVGSGTTLVAANVFGADAVGCDISAFNCLLTRVKTAPYPLAPLELGLTAVLEEARRLGPAPLDGASEWLRRWYAPQALGELLRYREVATRGLEDGQSNVAKIILSRSARSARLTTHFDLDFPRAPTTSEYFCHKHNGSAARSRRLRSSSRVTRRTPSSGSARSLRFGGIGASTSSTTTRGRCACRGEETASSPPRPIQASSTTTSSTATRTSCSGFGTGASTRSERPRREPAVVRWLPTSET